jgi:hypothetical protein
MYIYYHIKESIAFIGNRHRLLLDNMAKNLHELAKFSNLLLMDFIIHSIALNEVLLQDIVCPLAEIPHLFYFLLDIQQK